MNYIKFTQTACRNVAALLVCVLLATCGGSGGGGSNVTPMPQADKDAFHATAVAAYQTLGAGSSYPFGALKLSSPTGSGTRMQPAAILFSLSRGVAALRRAASRAGGSSALTFESSLNLYTDGGIFSGNVGTISYYSDAAGTQPAGTLTITLPTDITNLTDPTSYASYPAVITMNVNITGGNLPCTGNGQITFTGGSGANTMTGTLTLTKTNVVFTLDLALSDQLNASGSITITENGDTLHLTNVNGNPLSTLTCNVSVSPEGWTGTGTINLVTGAMTANLNTGTGATTISSDSSGKLNIVYADSTTETVGTGGGNTISATAITTAQNLTVGTAMTSFSPLTASGGATPYTYSHTGTLPDGLSFSSSTGAVTGTPTAAYATASLVFSVKDANNVVASTTSTVSFTVTVGDIKNSTPAFTWTVSSGGFNYTQGSYLEGFEFKANSLISITQLGAYDSNYNSLSNSAETFAPTAVGVYNITAHTLLGSITVNATDPVTGAFHYASLPTPIALNTTDTYAVVWVSGTNYYVASPTLIPSDVNTAINYLGYAGYGTGGQTMTNVLVEPDSFVISNSLNYDMGPNFMFVAN